MGSLGKNTRVGSHSLLQGLFPTQGANPDLLHCRQVLHQLSHQVSPVWHVSEFRRPHASVGGLPRRHCRVVGVQAGLPPCCPFRAFLAPGALSPIWTVSPHTSGPYTQHLFQELSLLGQVSFGKSEEASQKESAPEEAGTDSGFCCCLFDFASLHFKNLVRAIALPNK